MGYYVRNRRWNRIARSSLVGPSHAAIAAGRPILKVSKLYPQRPTSIADRAELAIGCALNRVGKSTDIQRLGLDLDCRHASA